MTQNSYDDKQICNIALSLIGADAISSLDEEDDVAAVCARLYPLVRDSLLSKNGWNFVNAKRQLAQVPNAPAVAGWKYGYQLPSGMLSGPFAVYCNGNTDPDIHFEVLGDLLYSNAESVSILYRQNGTDPATWPAYFIDLVTVALAVKLAKPVVDNATLVGNLAEEAFGPPEDRGIGGLFAQAKSLNAQSKRTQSIFRNGDPLTASRR